MAKLSEFVKDLRASCDKINVEYIEGLEKRADKSNQLNEIFEELNEYMFQSVLSVDNYPSDRLIKSVMESLEKWADLD
jgi:hypothetical protein